MGNVSSPSDVEAYGPVCPVDVAHPVMMHRWDTLTFLHWTYEPDVVARLLPVGLTLDTFDGKAWVGLVPFNMVVRAPHTPALPWVSRFCETNVRTYVIDEYGRPGIWFFSLDASRLGAVLTARATFRLPYMWSRMSLVRSGDVVTYSCSRRWPGPRGASSNVTIDIGSPFKPTELTQRDHFLTARWRLFSITGPGAFRRFSASAYARAGAGSWRCYGIAKHDPWVLHRATARSVDDSLVAAAGLPRPVDEPLVHFSPGVDVRIGPPHRLR